MRWPHHFSYRALGSGVRRSTRRGRRRAGTIELLVVLALVVTSCGLNFEGDPTIREASPSTPPTETPESDVGSSQDTENPAQPNESDSDEAEGQTSPADPELAEPDADPITPEPADERGDRLVVQTVTSQLFTIAPDGSDRVDLTDDAGSVVHRQPTWSADGSRIAWASTELATGRVSVRTDRFDLSGPTSAEVAMNPFYLSWAPSGAAVAFLSPGPAGIDLGLVPLIEGESPRRLDRGEPYWFSWGPDGDELLVHASGFRLDRIRLDGFTQVIEEFPSSFRSPVWLGDADTLIYADQLDGQNFLVTTGTLGEGRVELVSFDGTLSFIVNSDASRVAMFSRPTSVGADGGIVTASFPTNATAAQTAAAQTDPAVPDPEDLLPSPDEFFDAVDELPTGALSLIGTFGGDLWSVSNAEVVAFFWDPTGDTLAWLEPAGDGELEWVFSDGNQVWGGQRFTPSAALAGEYLPFFEQYHQSMTLFSPDGSEITFAGTLPSGEEGIFVMGTDRNGTPTKVADGVFSAWSPTGAAGAFSVL